MPKPELPLPGAFHVSGREYPGGVSLQLDALRIWAEGASLSEARANLVSEVRRRIVGYLTSPAQQRAPSMERRGPILETLAWLTNPEIDALLEVDMRVGARAKR